jgi:hypothetical protein
MKEWSHMAFIGNLLWFIFGGDLISLFLWVCLGLLMAITIIGIPFGLAHFKLAGVCFAPLGKKPVSNELAAQVRNVSISWQVCAKAFMNLMRVKAFPMIRLKRVLRNGLPNNLVSYGKL